ncbi:gliding motility-associated C-terminal domain-containing protein [Niastella caeni]|uniref:Gliding motility-associated C-terminal domain-containing protein n=1 Tax=Niastella caeni TaxID=2569763 RepID=A0A4S8HUJ0_9BACT|nr:gliding motility-associated C-terminal domain-containing protein [Niastella caeni]THU39273.1 gliding motility-associated C-terminal domain-containing protein [Niastella caeni]
MNTLRSKKIFSNNSSKHVRLLKGRRRGVLCIGLLLGLLITQSDSHGQTTYTPITVTGFHHDIVAETGTSVLATTTTMIDGSPFVARHVVYTEAFATANSLAGGMVDNGTIVNGTRTYQLASYADKNALYLSRNGTVDSTVNDGTLTLSTPGHYARLSLLLFSTEGSSRINVNLNYTDGTTERAVTNANVQDWYYGANAIYANFGRIQRDTTGPFTVDGVGSNPRFYAQDMFVHCDNQNRLLQSITVSDTSTSTGARVLVLAVSGEAIQPYSITPTVLPARCGVTDNGYISLAVSGGVKPFTYAWNTNPVQTTSFASGLPAGTYTCNVTDSNGCVRTYTGTVTLVTPAPVVAKATNASVCAGTSTTLYADTAYVVPSTYTWNPGGITGSAIVVSPTVTTSYIVGAEDMYGCTSADTILITVKPLPTASFTVDPNPVCPNTPQTVTYTGNAPYGATYNWNGFAGATVYGGSGQGPYNILFSNSGTYTLQLQVTMNGCSGTATKQVIVNAPLATPVVTVATVTSSTITFSWQPVPGATGYIVSVNGSPYITPTSGSLGTTHNIINLQPVEKITIHVIALGVEACRNSAIGTATGTTLTDQVFIPNSFTPNGDGKNDFFRAYGNVIAGINMKIFNQWGELIYDGSDVSSGWDGKQKGSVQPMGVYFYVIKIKFTNGTESIRKGAVNLLH